MTFCQICGNDIPPEKRVCPYCGSRQEGAEVKPKGILHKTINIEAGMPFVEPAIKRMMSEIETAKMERVSVVTIIHGYGSSGKGGAIRQECRKTLDYLQATGSIQDYIPGEEFSRKEGRVKMLLQRFSGLNSNKNLNRKNQGVTIAVL